MNRACPICDSKQSKMLDKQRVSSTEGTLRIFAKLMIVQCQQCGAKYTDKVPTEAELQQFYDQYRGKARASSEQPPVDFDSIQRNARSVSHLSLLSQFHPAPKQILEIGPGFGHTLILARIYLNASVYAFEPDEAATRYLEKLDIPNSKLLFNSETYNFFDKKFDVVVISNVLEHITVPVVFLQQIQGVLAPGGIVVCEVPNYSNALFEFRNSDDSHIFFPSVESLQHTAEKAGFKVSLCKACGPHWRDDPGRKAQKASISSLHNGLKQKVFRRIRLMLGESPFWTEDLIFREKGNTIKAVFLHN